MIISKQEFSVELNNYFTVLGPCHAEEVAAEKLSYLTFSGVDEETTCEIASHFKTPYLNTLHNTDIYWSTIRSNFKKYLCIGSRHCTWA